MLGIFKATKNEALTDMDLDTASVALDSSGIILGYTADTSEPLVVSWDDWTRHCLVVGRAGAGKGRLREWVSFQQIAHGGGLLYVDHHGDTDDLGRLVAMCRRAGREDDLLVIDPNRPERSVTYNPILHGDPEEIASRILSTIPPAEPNAGADFYKQVSLQGLAALIGALQRAGLAYNAADLAALLMDQAALTDLENQVNAAAPGSNEARNLSLFLDQFKGADAAGAVAIDMKKVKDLFGGIGGRLFTFGTGNVGKVMAAHTPDVNLFDAIRNNKIIYMALPTMGKSILSTSLGKLILGDFRSAIAAIQNLPTEDRPSPPFLNFSEVGLYAAQDVSRTFEQGRAAHISVMPALHTLVHLDVCEEGVKAAVLGNTWNKVFFNGDGRWPGAQYLGGSVTEAKFSEMQGALDKGEAFVVNPKCGMRRIRVPALKLVSN